ncbi:unnamed protein product [Polarella glacialis]|uniref:Uncharacterized protein n=1 Tax=Polarella glacialis TaxID=89957 RepID=A0A813FV13_POLGL|nr:unnamed protein product [Polarella glacialis]
MQLLPGLFIHYQVAGATWAWTPDAQCKPAAGSNWAFSTDVVTDGTSVPIVCSDSSLSPPAGKPNVTCPEARGTRSSTRPTDRGWYSLCENNKNKPGFPCAAKMEIGGDISCSLTTTTTTTTTAAATTTVAATTTAAATTTVAATTSAEATTAAAVEVNYADSGAAPGLVIAAAALAHLL